MVLPVPSSSSREYSVPGYKYNLQLQLQCTVHNTSCRYTSKVLPCPHPQPALEFLSVALRDMADGTGPCENAEADGQKNEQFLGDTVRIVVGIGDTVVVLR